MTIEEAKNELEEMRVEFDYTLHDEAANASYVALEALEKQIPKKPIDEYHRTAYCPACGKLIVDAYCCPECGQKIDWSEEE